MERGLFDNFNMLNWDRRIWIQTRKDLGHSIWNWLTCVSWVCLWGNVWYRSISTREHNSTRWFCKCETVFVTWREGYRLRALRKISVREREEITADWRRRRNEERHYVHSWPDDTEVIRRTDMLYAWKKRWHIHIYIHTQSVSGSPKAEIGTDGGRA